MKTKAKNQNIRKKIMYATVLMIFSAGIFAQEENTAFERTSLYGGYGYFSLSGVQNNIGELNNVLAANNYGKQNGFSSAIGGASKFIIKNFVIGGGGAWIMNSSASSPLNTVQLNGGYGLGYIGYAVHSSKSGVIYPTFGIGTGGYEVVLSEKSPQNDFASQVSSPEGMVILNAGGLITRLQLTYLHFFSKKNLDGLCLGIEVGYTYAPNNWELNFKDIPLANSPKINMNGLNVTITLGGGSFAKQ